MACFIISTSLIKKPPAWVNYSCYQPKALFNCIQGEFNFQVNRIQEVFRVASTKGTDPGVQAYPKDAQPPLGAVFFTLVTALKTVL